MLLLPLCLSGLSLVSPRVDVFVYLLFDGQTGDQKRPQPLARALRRRDFDNRLHAAGARRERRHGPRDRGKREYPRGRLPGEVSDGSVRERFRPLSEKMKPDETPEEAVFRAVREELGSIFSGEDDVVRRIKILPGSYSRRVEEKNSMSYPGLPARYALHSVDATVEGLPEEDFCTEENECDGESVDDSEETRAAGRAVTAASLEMD
ncbi:hypothetical protein F2Q68_00023931 [Brassica cretica]|uniref:Uncharacterized protein n=1 Tax=Brassica cretica TaxID=69181 RepID=A0A8S9I8D4_BRACR|nr:hypothetical protein F2Q68_00023931 [Brassica cretica]